MAQTPAVQRMGRNAKTPAVPNSWMGKSNPFPPGGNSQEVADPEKFLMFPAADTQQVADPDSDHDADTQPVEDTQVDLQQACHPPNPQI